MLEQTILEISEIASRLMLILLQTGIIPTPSPGTLSRTNTIQ